MNGRDVTDFRSLKRGDPDGETIPTDAQLMVLVARRRDEGAFNTIYRRYERRAYAMAYRCTGQRAAAEDAVQESMLQVWRSAASFKGGPLAGWIFKIVINKSRVIYKRLKKQNDRENGRDLSGFMEPLTERLKEEKRQHDLAQLSLLVNRLSARDRRLAVYYYGYGFTQNHIAQELGMAQRTVSHRLGKIIDRLRKAIGVKDPGLA